MNNKGDFSLGTTIDFKFTTINASGVPTSLLGTPVVSAYSANSTTELTAGITLTVDFDARTGLNHVRVVASGGNGYVSGNDYDLVITTGTVDGSSVVGYKIGSFSIEKTSALRPTVVGRTLDVAATGEAGLDFSNVLLPVGAIPALGITDNGTGQGATATTVQLRSAATFASDEIIGSTISIVSGTGNGQARVIVDYDGVTDTVTVSPNFLTVPSAFNYVIVPTAPAPVASGSLPQVEVADIQSAALAKLFSVNTGTTYASSVAGSVVKEIADNAGSGASILAAIATVQADTDNIQTRLPAALVNGRMSSYVGEMATNVLTSDALATSAVTEIQTGLATSTALTTLSNYVDTEVAAILAIANKLDTAFELDGAVYRLTANALEMAPAGGGGVADWTADERTQIRNALGIAPSGTTLLDPSVGILDTIRDAVVSGNASLTAIGSNVSSILQDTGTDIPALIAALNDLTANEIFTAQMTESYANNGVAPTLAQALFAIHQRLMEFSISGTTRTVKRLDGTTTAFLTTFDSADNATSESR